MYRSIAGRTEEIPAHEIKQIAGRAGRYTTASDDMKRAKSADQQSEDSQQKPHVPRKTTGLVTTLERGDLKILEKAMTSDSQPITRANLFPPTFVFANFASYFPPDTPFAYLLIQLHELGRSDGRYFVGDIRGQVSIADCIESVQGLFLQDRVTFCSAPIEPRRLGEPELARVFARCVAEGRSISVLDIEELDVELLDDDYVANRGYLERIERLHKGLIIYMWLSFRYDSIFLDKRLALHVKDLTERRIEETLEKLSFDYGKIRRQRERAIRNLLDAAPQEVTEESSETQLGAEDIANLAASGLPESQQPNLDYSSSTLEPQESTGDDFKGHAAYEETKDPLTLQEEEITAGSVGDYDQPPSYEQAEEPFKVLTEQANESQQSYQEATLEARADDNEQPATNVQVEDSLKEDEDEDEEEEEEEEDIAILTDDHEQLRASDHDEDQVEPGEEAALENSVPEREHTMSNYQAEAPPLPQQIETPEGRAHDHEQSPTDLAAADPLGLQRGDPVEGAEFYESGDTTTEPQDSEAGAPQDLAPPSIEELEESMNDVDRSVRNLQAEVVAVQNGSLESGSQPPPS